MAEAYLKDEKKLLPCAVQLNGEYGVVQCLCWCSSDYWKRWSGKNRAN